MLDGMNAARARLFENLRNDHAADVKAAESEKVLRIKPLTAGQAEALCQSAIQSLAPRA